MRPVTIASIRMPGPAHPARLLYGRGAKSCAVIHS